MKTILVQSVLETIVKIDVFALALAMVNLRALSLTNGMRDAKDGLQLQNIIRSTVLSAAER
jgi:hypothetical protein